MCTCWFDHSSQLILMRSWPNAWHVLLLHPLSENAQVTWYKGICGYGSLRSSLQTWRNATDGGFIVRFWVDMAVGTSNRLPTAAWCILFRGSRIGHKSGVSMSEASCNSELLPVLSHLLRCCHAWKTMSASVTSRSVGYIPGIRLPQVAVGRWSWLLEKFKAKCKNRNLVPQFSYQKKAFTFWGLVFFSRENQQPKKGSVNHWGSKARETCHDLVVSDLSCFQPSCPL